MVSTRDPVAYRRQAMKAVAELPPFSPVLDRLLATLSMESVSVSRVSEIIETDTVIAGNILKLVNSALYGRRGTVNSVRHAVSLLGINKLRNAVFAMSITRVWSKVKTAPGWSMANFNLHALACGLLSDCLAQRSDVEYPEGAFAAGLFRDLGQLLIAVALHDEFRAIQELSTSGFGPIVACEREVLGLSHADLSADALATWNLPDAIQQAARFHHEPESETTPRTGPHSLAMAVHCASEYVALGGPWKFTQNEPPPNGYEPFASLGIEYAGAQFLDEYRKELSALSGAFR